MKYKPGDIVKIKTWEEMVEEFEINWEGDIKLGSTHFPGPVEKKISKEFPNRIVTIKSMYSKPSPTEYEYDIEEPGGWFTSFMEEEILTKHPDRILTIRSTTVHPDRDNQYLIEESYISTVWLDWMIEGREAEIVPFDPVLNRFEIMDFDE